MGRGNSHTKLIKQWILEIPDSKLGGGIKEGGTVYSDKYMRLDRQRNFKDSDGVEYCNLQVQVNFQCPHATLKKLAPHTVAMCHAPVEDELSPEVIKQTLLKSVTGHAL